MTRTQVSTRKDGMGAEETVTTTQTSTKKGDRGIEQRVTKVTKTKKVIKKVTKVAKAEEEEEEEDEEESETKEAVSITELSDEDKFPEPSAHKSTKTTQHITSVCFLFLYYLNIHDYIKIVLASKSIQNNVLVLQVYSTIHKMFMTTQI